MGFEVDKLLSALLERRDLSPQAPYHRHSILCHHVTRIGLTLIIKPLGKFRWERESREEKASCGGRGRAQPGHGPHKTLFFPHLHRLNGYSLERKEKSIAGLISFGIIGGRKGQSRGKNGGRGYG